MVKDKVDKVKESKLFRGWDILVYVLLLILILVLLWVFIWRNPESSLGKIEVLIKDQIVMSYDFKTDEIHKNSELIELTNEVDKITAKIFIDEDKKHYNILIIDKVSKCTYVSDANCSNTKECTTMKPITKGGQNIICVPHQLIIRALGEAEIKDPISG